MKVYSKNIINIIKSIVKDGLIIYDPCTFTAVFIYNDKLGNKWKLYEYSSDLFKNGEFVGNFKDLINAKINI